MGFHKLICLRVNSCISAASYNRDCHDRRKEPDRNPLKEAKAMKGYTVESGYMGYVNGEYMLFASEMDVSLHSAAQSAA